MRATRTTNIARALGLALAALIGTAAPSAALADEAEPLPPGIEQAARGFYVAPIRYRHEYRDDYDLRADLNDSDNRDLFKLGFGYDGEPIEGIRTRVQARLTRTWGRNVEPPASTKIDPFGQDHLDLFEGFVDFPVARQVPIALRVGRQVLSYGEERLVGPLEFLQNPRTFDAVKARVGTPDLGFDAWWARLVQFEGPDDRNHNRPVETVDFFGLYGSWKPYKDLTVEPYYLVKFDDNRVFPSEKPGKRPDHHLLLLAPGARFVAQAPAGFRLHGDVIVEHGERGNDDIFAWGAATKVIWGAPEGIRPVKEIEVEYIYGSGDTNPRDGKVETLDNFYPTNHKFYGEVDLASWQNIHDIELTVRFELLNPSLREPPAKRDPDAPPPYIWERAASAILPAKLPVILEVGAHQFFLAARKDAWYNAPLRVVRRDPTGAAGRELGQEIDVVVRAGPLSFGYGHFFPGAFVRRTTPAGGNASGVDYAFLELGFSF